MNFINRLALNASAGSGKTFALTVRYIALLLMGANPSNIVALTFTKKAANEMQHRVYQTLQELENRESELIELCEFLQIEKEEVLARKNAVLPLFLRANIKISTIDSFLGQILRKFALYVGLMPDFTSKEIHNQNKFKELFIKMVKKDRAYEFLLFFALKSQKNINYVFKILSQMYEKNSEISRWNFPKTNPPESMQILKIVRDMRDFLIEKDAASRAVKLIDKNVDEIIKSEFLTKNTLMEHTYFKNIYTPRLDEIFFELKSAVKTFYEEQESYFLGELFYLFKIYKNSLKNMAIQNKELSFDDITNAVYELLQNHVESDFLYFRLDAQIEHLLIDEFQDTNIVQYKILEPIIKEITAGIGTKEFKSFFYVGDIKQAIYRFRGGMKELFSYIINQFGVTVDYLKYNYRSKSIVVEFINEVFKDKIANYEPQIAYKKSDDGFVKIKTYENVQDGVINSVNELLHEGVSPNDIAILCSTNQDAIDIKEAIVEAIPDIAVSTESHKFLVENPNVAAILEFLKYLYFKDELYGRNFLAFLGLDIEVLPNIQDFDINKMPLEIIKKCIDDFKIEANSDIVEFLGIVSQYEDIEELLFACEDIRDHSLDKNEGIRILTVHKSKGLEFSFVIIADRIQNKNNMDDLLMFDYDGIELKRLFITMNGRDLVDEAYRAAKERSRILDEEDELNRFYVAFTRAKNGLFIVRKNEKSLFERLNLCDMQKGKIEPQNEEQKSKSASVSYKGRSFGKQNVKVEKEHIDESFENIYFGLALHFSLEMMSAFNENELENSLISAKNHYGKLLEDKAFISIKRRISNLINSEDFKKALNNGVLYKEQPYMFEGKQRQIDVLIEKESEIVIIDYKTSSAAKESNIKQVLEYKRAVEFIKQKRVKPYLYYLHEKEVEIISL
ncbi:MAG: RecB-like helicase [Campylobacteraceae bacterium]|jgi:ATP-dependent exoDNAse (exonuclease V) beta subunit|nr:RecB-like helicase [Campylobacteraceae bacterium]